MSAVFQLGPGVAAGFTRRYDGGVSAAPFDTLNLSSGVSDDHTAVERNRQDAAARLGFDSGRVVWMDQVHGADVAVVTAPGVAPRVDGIVTTRDDLVLAALAADCLPILGADPDAGVLGAAHSGRAGTLAGIAPRLVEAMVNQGARESRITVALGPAICGRCYEVPEWMRDEMAERLPQGAGRTSVGTASIDLRAAVTAQFEECGVHNVVVDRRCTLEDPDLFSHRRTGMTGRFAGYIWWC
ncbi:peptidoglycan editing factor PgeF [Haloactinospora alba]|nr:peptidoglycan editing factor PgeF [Haloactinospora alba]